MKRRKFLKNASLSFPMILGGVQLGSVAYSQKLARLTNSNEETDRVLVLIQLNGGNDGLNTLVPLDQYDNLYNVRKNIIIPENKLLKMRGYELGLHPSFDKINGLFDDRLVGIIQNVGYPLPNKSHFRSTDIWTSASSATDVVTTGWLGRYFDNIHPDYPDGYPNQNAPDPIAVTVGSLVSNTCQGPVVNMSIPVANLSSFKELTGESDTTLPDTPFGKELGYVRESIRQTNAYNETLAAAADKGRNTVTYPVKNENKLAYQLGIVAKLISGGLKTRVYVVNLGGFDTHSAQADSDVTKGKHASLLNDISEAVYLFMQDLQSQNLQDRVAGMTFSEFGRRIKSNESKGTDHGEAAPMFFFGNRVNPRIFGDNPEIENIEAKTNVPMQYDFRSVYGSVMQDWFGTEPAVIRDVLMTDYEYIPIFNRQAVVTGFDEPVKQEYLGQNYPNPFKDATNIPFKSIGDRVQLRLLDERGAVVATLINRTLSRGRHVYRLTRNGLPPGIYIYELKIRNTFYRKKLVIQ